MYEMLLLIHVTASAAAAAVTRYSLCCCCCCYTLQPLLLLLLPHTQIVKLVAIRVAIPRTTAKRTTKYNQKRTQTSIRRHHFLLFGI
jgi:hypothetical protein